MSASTISHGRPATTDIYRTRRRHRATGARLVLAAAAIVLSWAVTAAAATPCDDATHPEQCGWFDAGTLPPFVHDAIVAKGGVPGPGNVLVLTSGDPADPDSEISNDVGRSGCGTNPDGWETYDCVLLDQFVPPEDSVALALSSEWFEWYQTIFTDWMTISGAGVATVDVSINSWIDNKVDILPYGPWETGVVILTSLSASKMVDFRVADSGDHIYDTAIVIVPATWLASVDSSDSDATLLCGNGELEPGEDCDDGNYLSDDDCSSLCIGTQAPPSVPTPSKTCGNLSYVWPTGATAPYTCGQDLCNGFRCVIGDTISPACYTADQCAAACAGACVDVQTAQLDCSTMCGVQPSASEPPPVVSPSCAALVYQWPDGTTMPYSCDDTCEGERCVTDSAISPECYGPGECDDTTCPDGSCVSTPAADCDALCALGEKSETCLASEKDMTRVAANQQGACFGNLEACSGGGFWEIADGSWQPTEEECNGIDDDCNGVADDMFVTCGDPGLCENTVNTCDPTEPSVPVVCEPLLAPSPFEICNDGLDNDCDGAADDGCECGDDECMAGETYEDCEADCPAPDDGTPCEDGDLCTSGDSWQGGACTAGEPVVCDDGNACVVDPSCDPATGCSATKVDCTDTADCTEDGCDATLGCFHTPIDSLCDDADPCTVDTCELPGGCAHAPDPSCEVADADGDGYAALASGGSDCDDDDSAVFPGAIERCNGTDDNCDGANDDGFAVGAACASAPNDCGTTAAGTLRCSDDGVDVTCDALTPANPAGYGDACTSPANACGLAAAGTFRCTADGLDIACDAETPENPAGYGDACNSPANVCGDKAAGTLQCDGSCDASMPQAADTDADTTPDCVDACPADAAKIAAGACGCGVADSDGNANGIVDCQETVLADLAASVEQVTARVRAGKPLKYSLVVSNLGPATVPTATIMGSITGGPLASVKLPRACTGPAAAFTCSTAKLAGGRRAKQAIVAVAPSGATVTVSASVVSAVYDPNATNQSATITTLVP